MSPAARRIFLSAIAIAVVALVVGVWFIRGPGPMAFADGPKVALADYKAGDPTGVPAALAKASPVERGAYLAKAADCMVCHTVAGRQGVCRRPRLQPAVRHAVLDQHHARQGDRHRQLQRPGFPRRDASRRAPRRRAALSGHALYLLHLHHRCGRAGDQGLSVQPAAGARGGAHQYAGVSVQPALGDGLLVGAVQSGHALSAGHLEDAGMEPRRLSCGGAGALRRMPYAAQPGARRWTIERNLPAR